MTTSSKISLHLNMEDNQSSFIIRPSVMNNLACSFGDRDNSTGLQALYDLLFHEQHKLRARCRGRLSPRCWCNRRCYCRSRSNLWCRCGGPQLLRDSFGYLSPDRKVVSQFAIKRIAPKMQTVACVDQLHVYAHSIATLLHAAFQDMGYAQLLGDLRQVFRRAFVMLRGSARDYL